MNFVLLLVTPEEQSKEKKRKEKKRKEKDYSQTPAILALQNRHLLPTMLFDKIL